MNGSITIHAGESFGPESIWQALQYCGAHRIGHGTRLIEDMVLYEGKVVHVGPLAQLRPRPQDPARGLSLEQRAHRRDAFARRAPLPHFLRLGYRVTLNTDNRLMSRTTLTDEYAIAVEQFGCSLEELGRITLNSMRSAFFPYFDRIRIIQERVRPGYAALGSGLGGHEWPSLPPFEVSLNTRPSPAGSAAEDGTRAGDAGLLRAGVARPVVPDQSSILLVAPALAMASSTFARVGAVGPAMTSTAVFFVDSSTVARARAGRAWILRALFLDRRGLLRRRSRWR